MKLELLKSCADNQEAALLRGLLEASGVPCVVQGEQHRSLLGMLGEFISVNVLVRAEDLARARELLAAEAAAPSLPPDDDDALPEIDPEARCARHDRPAVMACERCGTFLCSVCGPQRPCAECDERLFGARDARRARNRRVIAVAMLFLFLGGPGVVAAALALIRAFFQ